MILKDLPSSQSLVKKSGRYPNMNIQATEGYLHLMRAGTLLRHGAERRVEKRGLSYGKFMVLAILQRMEEPMPVCTLARMAGVTTPTVSAVISGMVRDGLVERLEDSQDRRVVRIAMLPKGLETLDKVMPELFEYHQVVMGALTHEEQQSLLGLLLKLREGLDTCQEAGAN